MAPSAQPGGSVNGDEAIEGAGNDVSSGPTIDGIGTALIGGALALIS